MSETVYWIDSDGILHDGHGSRFATEAEQWFQAERDRFGETLERIAEILPSVYDGTHLVDCPYVDVLLRIRKALA